MAFGTVSGMFVITTVAFGNKPSVRRHETTVDTRHYPSQLADPETTPWMLPYTHYSAVIGFLVNQGTVFIDSPRQSWFPDQKGLRFSSVSLSFLEFIQTYFEGYFYYGHNAGITRLSDKNVSLQTMNSNLTMHLYQVWDNENGEMILPQHFEQFFTWHTLAFWIMRNGLVQRKNLRIGVTSLGMVDKLRVQAVLKDKYGLTSTMVGHGSYLSMILTCEYIMYSHLSTNHNDIDWLRITHRFSNYSPYYL